MTISIAIHPHWSSLPSLLALRAPCNLIQLHFDREPTTTCRTFRMPSCCPQLPPVNKEVVLAIQGGGIYALPMLGQARALLDANYIPVGFAGNSGGAILAALLWSGLKPRRIEAAFMGLLKDRPGAFADLLLPRDVGVPQSAGLPEPLRSLPGRLKDVVSPRQRGPRRAVAFARLLCAAPRIWREVIELARARGAFGGERFTDFVDMLIREGLELSGPGMARFRDVPPGRPPLLLTVTNVSHGRLDVIDSTDRAFGDVEIARAVRASSGFPGFFQPTDLPGVGEGRCFVDGGMVANFPLWAFSASFRERLGHDPRYGWFAPRPWIPVGLRVREDATEPVDVQSPSAFAARLALIATGMARNDLEDRLVAEALPNHLSVVQAASSMPVNPATGKPLGFLDVAAVTAANLGDIIRSGEAEANKVILASGNRQVYDPGCGPPVLAFLADLLVRCEHAMGCDPAEIGLRANVFLPVLSRMEMRFGVRMSGHLDDGLAFDRLDQGLVGVCYQSRSGCICNLEHVGRAHARAPAGAPPYGMDRGQQQSVDQHRTWLISYPIFDPAERRSLRSAPSALPRDDTPGMRRLATEHTGPILGVLNVDAAWVYDKLGLDPSPDLHFDDRRIVAVIDTVAQGSLRLASLLVGRGAPR